MMNDIRKYIEIIEAEGGSGDGSDSNDNRKSTEVSKYVSLIENAMRVDESFKTAQDKFNEVHDDPKEVQEYIETFKDLAKRNIIKGHDKDIGKWIKAG